MIFFLLSEIKINEISFKRKYFFLCRLLCLHLHIHLAYLRKKNFKFFLASTARYTAIHCSRLFFFFFLLFRKKRLQHCAAYSIQIYTKVQPQIVIVISGCCPREVHFVRQVSRAKRSIGKLQ